MKTSIVIPVYNGELTITKTLDSIFAFSTDLIEDIVIVNDHSTDKSRELCMSHPINSKFNLLHIYNEKNLGLAASLNVAIKRASGENVMIIQQDMLVPDPETPQRLLDTLRKDTVVAVNPTFYLPKKIWDTYPFWQKVLFDRLVEKRSKHFSNKCDIVKKSALERVGYFDETHYRTAGECQDLRIRLEIIGKVVCIDDEVIHNHPVAQKASLFYMLWKDAQLAEAYGVNLRRHGLRSGSLFSISMLLVRPILAFFLLIPWVNLVVIPIVLYYTYAYSKATYKERNVNVMFFADRKYCGTIYLQPVFL